jgi:hypothetical protein
MPRPKTEVKINDGAVTNKRRAKPIRHSNFYITINTQRRFADTSDPAYEPYKAKFIAALSEFADNLHEYVKINEEGVEFEEKWFNVPRVQMGIEIGPTTKCLHAHMLVCIPHRTSISLRYDKLRAHIEAAMEGSIHMNAKLYRNAGDTLENYVFKDVVTDE